VAELTNIIDPQISKAKFDREIATFWRYRDMYAQRGCFIVGSAFPEVRAIFCAAKAKPAAVVFGAVMRFDNYDFWPPSVKLANPFTFIPYKANELPTLLAHKIPADKQMNLPQMFDQIRGQMPQGMQLQFEQVHSFMQAFEPGGEPFICMPGIREYHDCPAHTGDVWLRHRAKGEGTLDFILNKLLRYGVEPLTDYQITLQPVITGFVPHQPPE
jgi:hypothetical protein